MKDKLTIAEIRERKETLEKSIKELVESFANETDTLPKVEIGPGAVAMFLGLVSYKVNISIKI